MALKIVSDTIHADIKVFHTFNVDISRSYAIYGKRSNILTP